MNLNYLKQFLELSSHTSMNQYATYRSVTHAQVSRMVMELEKEFGCILLVRGSNRSNIKLTNEGEMLIKRIPIIFNEIDYMHKTLSYNEEIEGGIFDLYTTTHIIDYWIAPYLSKFQRDNPNVVLNLIAKEDAPLEEEKKRYLTISSVTKDSRDYIQVPLKNFHISLWASQDYIEHYSLPENIADLRDHTLICFDTNWSNGTNPAFNWFIDNINFTFDPENIVIITSSMGFMKAAQTGLGIFPFAAETINIINMNFERVLPDLSGPVIPMCLSYPKEWQSQKSVKIIQNFLIDIFNNQDQCLPQLSTMI